MFIASYSVPNTNGFLGYLFQFQVVRIMKADFDCQLDWILRSLGDMVVGLFVRPVPDSFN